MKISNHDNLEMLNEYLSKGIHDVKGWCVPQLWQTLWPLYQETGEGAVAEIGVFEGKFFIALCKTFGIGRAYRAAAIDVFDMQQFNLDGAGIGKKSVLKANIERHNVDLSSIEFIQTDSLSLRSSDANKLIEKIGNPIFFSVDGCHEVVHTVKDIEFAMSVTADRGVIAVDDYTNPDWPGVTEAVARMYINRDFSFVPLAVTCNKLLLVSYSYHRQYLESIVNYISRNHPATRVKKVKRFGFDTLTIKPQQASWEKIG